MWYVCDELYAVLYVRINCFVVRGCAASRRYMNVCDSDMLTYLTYWHRTRGPLAPA